MQFSIHESNPDRLAWFEDRLKGYRADLIQHPIYAQLTNLNSLRVFMKSHVFAVWDFMSLLKTLQWQLTCTRVPWLPPAQNDAARFINEIVVGEESDEVSPGVFMSHFELYLQAMKKAGAEIEPVRIFTQRIAQGLPIPTAFSGLSLVPQVMQFVGTTLRFCTLPPHQVAAVFLYGREDIIPEMFQLVLRELNLYDAPDYAPLKVYLERHIHVDGETHGPLARKMLHSLCGENEQYWNEALLVAQEAMQARKLLWDGISHELSAAQNM